MYAKPLIAAALIFTASLCRAATSGPATSTAPAPRQWGRAKAGLSVSVSAAGRWVAAEPMKADFAIRNTGAIAASLGGREKFFGYLLIAQGRNIYYTEKIIGAARTASWPERLDPGGVLLLPAVDVGRLKAFSYMRGLKVVGGYPSHVVSGKERKRIPAGSVAEVLRPGTVKIKYVARLDRGLEGSLLLEGKMIKVTLEVGAFSRLPPAEQKRILADLAARMRKDAFSARSACGDAVRIGPPAVPVLVRIINDGRAEGFARMWAAAALAGIGGGDAVDVLIDCLTDSSAGVRHVAAYHGLKAGNEKFDKALTKRAVSGADAMVTAWAIMGYLKFRKEVPPALLAAGIDSPNWKARAAVAETILRGKPDRSHLPILRRLVRDENAMIRLSAAKAVRYVADNSRRTIDALIEGLALEGDNARSAIAEALCALTKKKWAYRITSTAEEKQEVIRKWQQWWEQNQ